VLVVLAAAGEEGALVAVSMISSGTEIESDSVGSVVLSSMTTN
jgi:hypothetical protein